MKFRGYPPLFFFFLITLRPLFFFFFFQGTVEEVLRKVGAAQDFLNTNASQIIKTVSRATSHMSLKKCAPCALLMPGVSQSFREWRRGEGGVYALLRFSCWSHSSIAGTTFCVQSSRLCKGFDLRKHFNKKYWFWSKSFSDKVEQIYHELQDSSILWPWRLHMLHNHPTAALESPKYCLYITKCSLIMCIFFIFFWQKTI